MPEIVTMYVPETRPDEPLMVKFTPSEGVLWRGVGRYIDRCSKYSETLDQAGEELLELIGRHRQVASVELLSVEHKHYADGLVFIWPAEGVGLEELANIVGRAVANYHTCLVELVPTKVTPEET